jgi:hypothetical protein
MMSLVASVGTRPGASFGMSSSIVAKGRVRGRCSGLDADMANARVRQVPVKEGLKLATPISAHRVNPEWERRDDMVQEGNSALLRVWRSEVKRLLDDLRACAPGVRVGKRTLGD